MLTFADQVFQRRSFVLAQTTTYFLTVTSDMSRFQASVMTLPENQRTNSRSMTGGTRVRSSAPAEVNSGGAPLCIASINSRPTSFPLGRDVRCQLRGDCLTDVRVVRRRCSFFLLRHGRGHGGTISNDDICSGWTDGWQVVWGLIGIAVLIASPCGDDSGHAGPSAGKGLHFMPGANCRTVQTHPSTRRRPIADTPSAGKTARAG
jgi:hypothetical protein